MIFIFFIVMKIVVCPTAFKGVLSPEKAASIIAFACKKVFPFARIIKVPLGDGGTGTLEVLKKAGFKVCRKKVRGPLGNKVTARFLFNEEKKLAFIEMAQASGITLVPRKKRNPLITTTYGTGELIIAALKKKAKIICIGLGGSATTDAGIGMAQALGVRFLDEKGNEIRTWKEKGYAGITLPEIKKIDVTRIDKRIKKTKFFVWSDVINPLYGRNGAAFVFAAQKGANKKEIEFLDKALKDFSIIVRKELGKNLALKKGVGAAGGLAYGLMVFVNGKLKRGVNEVMKLLSFERKISNASLIITGEGCLDSQTCKGKVVSGVARKAKEKKIKAIAIVGCTKKGFKCIYNQGINLVIDASNGKNYSKAYIKRNATTLLRKASLNGLLNVKKRWFNEKSFSYKTSAKRSNKALKEKI